MSIGSKFHLVTLGCPKNEVDSEKIAGTLFAEGMKSTDDLNDADLIVVNTWAERYGKEMQDSLPEVDHVAGFGVPVSLTRKADVPELDLLNLPRPASGKPWAYLKIAEGCDRACGYCSIPSFRGPQRSRSISSIIEEVDALEVKEVVLVAQDLAAFGRDQGIGEKSVIPLIEEIVKKVEWVRLLYLYPSELNTQLIEAVITSPVGCYFIFRLKIRH